MHRHKDSASDETSNEMNGNRIGRLKTFLSGWVKDHVSSEDAAACEKWMQGPQETDTHNEIEPSAESRKEVAADSSAEN